MNTSPLPVTSSAQHTPAAHDIATQEFLPVEPWPQPVVGHLLLDKLVQVLSLFVVFPKWAAETFALWIIHTYAFHLRNICTYIAVESPEKECGKSTLLTVLSNFVHRPVVSSNITSSAFFRLIEEFEPTLLIDEADTNLRGSDELRGILNAGYFKPNAFVWRVTYEPTADLGRDHEADLPNNRSIPNAPHSDPSFSDTTARASVENPITAPSIPHSSVPASPPTSPFPPVQNLSFIRGSAPHSKLARFTCWCPKVIASIGRVHDTLASRCIVVRMHRKAEGEECHRLKFLDSADLKRQCARFALDNAAAIAAAEPAIPAGLANRAADVWEPLLAIADLAGGRWPELARQAALALTATSHDRSPIASLLLDILVIFAESDLDRLSSRDLAATLNCYTDRPWADLRKGKSIDELWLSKQLRPYGIRPRTLRIGDRLAKGYAPPPHPDPVNLPFALSNSQFAMAWVERVASMLPRQ